MPTISITTDAANAQRVAAAFGKYWNLGRDATTAEIREYLVRQLKAVVKNVERGETVAQFDNSTTDVVTT